MFGLFKKDQKKQLEKKYARLLKIATDFQRNGDMASFAKTSKEADDILKEIEKIEAKQ